MHYSFPIGLSDRQVFFMDHYPASFNKFNMLPVDDIGFMDADEL
jgi:hypothetical protein